MDKAVASGEWLVTSSKRGGGIEYADAVDAGGGGGVEDLAGAGEMVRNFSGVGHGGGLTPWPRFGIRKNEGAGRLLHGFGQSGLNLGPGDGALVHGEDCGDVEVFAGYGGGDFAG